MLAHSLVINHLDYCDSLLIDISKCVTERFKDFQSKTAELTVRKREGDSHTLLKALHWLHKRS